MRKTIHPLILILVVILVGCTRNVKPEVSPPPTPKPSATSLPSNPQITALPVTTQTPRTVSTSTLLPTDPSQLGVIRRCFDINPLDQFIHSPSGTAVLSGWFYNQPSSLLDFSSGKKRVLPGPDEGLEEGFYISPNQEWYAYRLLDHSTGASKLLVADSNGEILATVSWNDPSWRQIAGWANDTQLLISKQVSDSDIVNDIILALNPFTGVHKDLPFDDPHIYPPFPEYRLWGGLDKSLKVYDPTLAYVAYIRGSDLVIKNIETGIETGSIDAKLIFAPQWSPDGSKVVFVKRRQSDELFSMDKQGNLEQLTRLSLEGDNEISGFSISPNGRYIAIWISWDLKENYPDIYPDIRPEMPARLAIYDWTSKKLIDTCIPIVAGRNNPVWSPDNRFLLTNDFFTGESPARGHVYLINLDESTSAMLEDNLIPHGWLVKK